MQLLPASRLRQINAAPVNPAGRYVLYWMTAARRTSHNHALERAAWWARSLGRPLLVLEALGAGYEYASDRLHAFIMQGMADNLAACRRAGVVCLSYVEPQAGHGQGLVETLAAQASVVVTDHYPSFFLPRLTAAAGRKIGVKLEAVDSCGLVPLGSTGEVFASALAFRRFWQRRMAGWLAETPAADPLSGLSELGQARLPEEIDRRWPAADPEDLARPELLTGRLPIDHGVAPAPVTGGPGAAGRRLADFAADGLRRYHTDAAHPDLEAVSGLSPYLHFGHLGAHQVFWAVAEREGWTPERLGEKCTGKRAGWWGMGPGAEAFLDQLVTWRELGFNFCDKRADQHSYDSLPDWARATLDRHTADTRAYIYGPELLARARTHDELWNAAQRQLTRTGVMHNYLRMLWGKLILTWSATPAEALSTMVELNDRYSLDGRDPNSYSGICWVLGRYDRPWPEREVFGKVRSMTSASTRKKLKLTRYLERFGPRPRSKGA